MPQPPDPHPPRSVHEHRPARAVRALVHRLFAHPCSSRPRLSLEGSALSSCPRACRWSRTDSTAGSRFPTSRWSPCTRHVHAVPISTLPHRPHFTCTPLTSRAYDCSSRPASRRSLDNPALAPSITGRQTTFAVIRGDPRARTSGPSRTASLMLAGNVHGTAQERRETASSRRLHAVYTRQPLRPARRSPTHPQLRCRPPGSRAPPPEQPAAEDSRASPRA